jgi:outer membrane protein
MRSLVACGMMALALPLGASHLAAQNPTRPAANAQPAPAGQPARVAFVNAGALLKGMPDFSKAESTWTKEAEVADAEVRKLQTVFDSAVAQYQQSQALLTPSTRSTKEKQLGAQQDSLQAKINQIQVKVQQRQGELLAPMQDRLRAIIEGIRAESNYSMIIDVGSQASANIVAYDKSLDITVRVAQRLAASN